MPDDESLLDFIPRISPDRRSPYHLAAWCGLIERALDEPVRGLCAYPIQHWKTETTMHGVVWLLLRNPKLHVIVLTYSKDRAEWWGKHCRAIAEQTRVRPARGFNRLTEWENEEGGGVVVMSADQSRLGYPCDVLIFDDPLDEHNAKDQKVRTEVDRAIAHYTARATVSGVGSVLGVMSRWHPDDPYGLRVDRKEEGWEEHTYPGVSKDPETGEERAFAPDVCSLAKLKKVYAELHAVDPSDRLWEAQIQNNPKPDSLSSFGTPARYVVLPEWPGFVDAMGFDMSFTRTKKSDWSAIVALRIYATQVFVKEILRFRAEIRQAKTELMAAMVRHPEAMIYSFMSGPESSVARLYASEGIPIYAKSTQDPKLVRAQRTMAAWNEKKILLPAAAPGISDAIKRFQKFTGDEANGDDDEVDAMSSVYECAVYQGGGTEGGFGNLGMRRC